MGGPLGQAAGLEPGECSTGLGGSACGCRRRPGRRRRVFVRSAKSASEGVRTLLARWGCGQCGNDECVQAIELTRAEYEAVRAHARRFAIAPDHENPTVEVVTGQTSRFAVAETFVGEASRIPEETDPAWACRPRASGC